MPMWRCPHCGTPQAETARCWVCRRSSTACGTCRHFRRAVAANLGYCGLDQRRQPLAGDEIRACWEAGTQAPIEVDGPRIPAFRANGPEERARLDFVELELAPQGPAERLRPGARKSRPAASAVTTTTDATTASSAADEPPEPVEPIESLAPPELRWSLWGDLER